MPQTHTELPGQALLSHVAHNGVLWLQHATGLKQCYLTWEVALLLRLASNIVVVVPRLPEGPTNSMSPRFIASLQVHHDQDRTVSSWVVTRDLAKPQCGM